MLVLTRQLGESIDIDIGTGVRVTVVHITAGKVRIGIEAPADVSIRRSELPPADAVSRPNSLALPADDHEG